VARSGIHAEVMEGVKPKIERSFESSRLEGELLAVAYETVVPIPGTVSSRGPLERLQTMAAAIPAGHETPVLRAQG